MKIEIKYYVDSSNFSDEDFENQPQRTFVIDSNTLSDILRQFGTLKGDEILSEYEVEIKK